MSNKVLGILIFFVIWEGSFYIREYAYSEDEGSEILRKKLEQRISLDLRNMNVVDVYKFLAFKGKFNISISKNVSGRVTLFLKNVSIKDALDIISIANNLGYRLMGDNIIHVMTEEEYLAMYGKRFSDKRIVKIIYLKYAKPAYVLEALKNIKSDIGRVVIDEDTGSVVMIDMKENIERMERAISKMEHPLETRIYDLKYAKAEDVAAKLRQKIENKAVGSVQADVRSNQIIVRAFPERLEEVGELIRALDKKTKAVLIEVRILKVVLNPKLNQGIDWEAIFKDLNSLDLVGSFPISSEISTKSALGTVGKIAVGNVDEDNFRMELKMLKQVSETKVLANPRIMVTDREEARIHIGDKLAFVTTTTVGTGEAQRINEEVHFIDVGVKFKVTPIINDDGFISMKIQPEISSKSGELVTPQGAKIPLINTTVVETDVIVKDGNTIVIGGLRQDELIRIKKGIPGLMDIPGLGKIFSNYSKEKVQSEIVIFLTPHIVSGEENIVDREFKRKGKIKPDKTY